MTTPNKNGNGVAQANGNGKTADHQEKTTALAVIKPEEKKAEIPLPTIGGKKISEFPPLEDRILKVNQLFSLVEKHETLLETKKKLKAFKLSTDGTADTLQLRDSRGNTFATSNSACIADVLEVLRTSIDVKIADVQAQIKF